MLFCAVGTILHNIKALRFWWCMCIVNKLLGITAISDIKSSITRRLFEFIRTFVDEWREPLFDCDSWKPIYDMTLDTLNSAK